MHTIWAVVMMAGLAGWLCSTLFFIFRSFPGRGRFLARPALTWGCVLVVSYVIWIVGMLHA